MNSGGRRGNRPGADGEALMAAHAGAPGHEGTAPAAGGAARIAPARHQDEPAVRALLRSCGLPEEDVGRHLGAFLVAHHEATLIATIGLEVLPRGLGLLRSLAVAPSWRGRSLGRSLCLAMIAEAEARGVGELWLLTTSAERYFADLGFASAPRAECPPEVRATAEFSALCPATAICMRKCIARDPGVPHGSHP